MNNIEVNNKFVLNVNDKFQNYVNENFPEIKKYSLINELMFYGIFVYYYYFGPIQDSVQNFLIAKYIILVFVLRYIFNSITNLTDKNKDEKKNMYSQFNSKLAIFIIMIFFLSKTSETLNSNTTLAIIFGYTLLTSAISNETTTVDNIFTVILILYVFSLNLLN
jgi:membrane-associated HD superfamily phosphohydrolase